MSILNVNKINPVGGGSTITIAGIASVTGNVTATGTITGEHHGDGSNLTGISGVTKIETGNTSVETSDTGSDGLVKVLVDGSEKVRINNNGQIGINTTSPDTFIHVGSATTNTHFLKFEADMGASTNRVFNIFGPDIANSSAPFTFQTGNGYLFKCDAEHSFEISSDRIVKINNGYGSLAPIYGVRAWIAFKAAGGSNTVRGSGNATMTDHGTGDFTMNFTTAMPDTGYSAVGTAGYNSGIIVLGLTGSGTESAPTTSGFRFTIRANYNNATLMDEEYINLMVVR
tara:strand:+ start:878 stop:1732 length:855 start_codon:yes stop_codon:yes gene_type:complete